jgi:hypothetical protein
MSRWTKAPPVFAVVGLKVVRTRLRAVRGKAMSETGRVFAWDGLHDNEAAAVAELADIKASAGEPRRSRKDVL